MTIAYVSRLSSISALSPAVYSAPTICSAHQHSTSTASTTTTPHTTFKRYTSCRRYASSQSSNNSNNSSGLSCYVWGTSSTVKYPNIAKTQLRPTQMDAPNASGFKQVTFGQQHTALLSGDGQCYTFGSFFAEPKSAISSWFGSKSTPADSDSSTTAQLQPVTNIDEPIKQIGLGVAHTIILTESGKVYTYGYGGSFMSSGALGHGDTETLQQPKLVEALQDQKIVRIASGSWHNLALTEDGKVYAWGRGEHGRLGTGSSNDVAKPVLLEALKHVKISQIRAGTSFNAAITDDGRVFTFGRNNAGQLGLGAGLTLDTYSMESVPSEVEFDLSSDTSITDETIDNYRIADIDCGYRHAVCVDNHHHVWYWGQNKNFTPLLIKGDDSKFLKNDIVRVAAGKNFSAAIDKHGHLFTWGDGGSCCLGHGDKSTVKWPRLVEGFGPASSKDNTFGRVVSIFAGDTHIAVLTKKD